MLNRDECINLVRHGGASIQENGKKTCLSCHTEVTEADLEERVRRMGGPGHWLGCKLPKDHGGDCVVGGRSGR